MTKQWQVRLFGLVQGVFMRASIQEKAKSLKITGFVRNLPDGSIEIKAVGKTDSLNRFLTWLKSSPGYSEVSHIDKEEQDKIEEFDDFRILY